VDVDGITAFVLRGGRNGKSTFQLSLSNLYPTAKSTSISLKMSCLASELGIPESEFLAA
jgi:hypothetical protein